MIDYDTWKLGVNDSHFDEADEDPVECPVTLFYPPKVEGVLFRNRYTGKFMSAKEAADWMKQEGYSGEELDEALSELA